MRYRGAIIIAGTHWVLDVGIPEPFLDRGLPGCLKPTNRPFPRPQLDYWKYLTLVVLVVLSPSPPHSIWLVYHWI
jgi:hypothetical protein